MIETDGWIERGETCLEMEGKRKGKDRNKYLEDERREREDIS